MSDSGASGLKMTALMCYQCGKQGFCRLIGKMSSSDRKCVVGSDFCVRLVQLLHVHFAFLCIPPGTSGGLVMWRG